MKVKVKESELELVMGDITTQDTDGIVNAANQRLLGGGGVDGAIHKAAGHALYEECKALSEMSPGIRCATGEARITGGYNLQASYVIHTVGPVYTDDGSQRAAELLKNCYHNSLSLALERGLKSIAFPSISTGIYGYPVKDAAPIALSTIWDFLENHTGIHLVRMILFGERDFQLYQQALTEIAKQKGPSA